MVQTSPPPPQLERTLLRIGSIGFIAGTLLIKLFQYCLYILHEMTPRKSVFNICENFGNTSCDSGQFTRSHNFSFMSRSIETLAKNSKV
jgi:hypothetical protein